MGIGMFLVTDPLFIFLSFLYFSLSTYTCVCMCVRVQSYTHSNPSHMGAGVICQTREDAVTAAFCLLSISHRNPFQQPMLFICLYYLVLNIIKVIKTALFGSLKLPQWRGLFIYFGVCLFFYPPPFFL